MPVGTANGNARATPTGVLQRLRVVAVESADYPASVIPFSREAFIEVFRTYNEAAWPAQLVLTVLALGAVVGALRGTRRAGAFAGVVVVVLWSWMAVAYHWIYFVRVTPAAWLFGAMFIGEAVLLARALLTRRLRFGVRLERANVLGLATIFYALVIYPLLGTWSDHPYPRSPSFGLPCPTTIFTLGMLLLTAKPVPRSLLAIPVAWAAIATMAPLKFGIWEDLGLVIAAVVVPITLVLRDRERPVVAPPTQNLRWSGDRG